MKSDYMKRKEHQELFDIVNKKRNQIGLKPLSPKLVWSTKSLKYMLHIIEKEIRDSKK